MGLRGAVKLVREREEVYSWACSGGHPIGTMATLLV